MGLWWEKEEDKTIPYWCCHTSNPIEEILLGHFANNVIGTLNFAIAFGGVDVAGSMVPGVGETMDVMVLQDPTSRCWEKSLALTSLTLNLFTAGYAPNIGGCLRAGKKMGVNGTEYLIRNESAVERVSALKRLRNTNAGRFVRRTLPELPESFAKEFEGVVRIRTFKKGERIYRSPWPDEMTDHAGRWFGTCETVTRVGNDSMYQVLKWKNPNTRLRVYEFSEDVTVYYGKVRGGKGFQVYIPDDVDIATALRYVSEKRLR